MSIGRLQLRARFSTAPAPTRVIHATVRPFTSALNVRKIASDRHRPGVRDYESRRPITKSPDQPRCDKRFGRAWRFRRHGLRGSTAALACAAALVACGGAELLLTAVITPLNGTWRLNGNAVGERINFRRPITVHLYNRFA